MDARTSATSNPARPFDFAAFRLRGILHAGEREASKSADNDLPSSKQPLTAFPVRHNLIDAPERANLCVERKIRLEVALSSRATTEAQREN